MAESDAIMVRGRKNLRTQTGESERRLPAPDVAIHIFHSFFGPRRSGGTGSPFEGVTYFNSCIDSSL